MRSQANYIWLLAAGFFVYAGIKQFQLANNVDALERAGRLTRETAARIRRKPMRAIGCLCMFAGLCFAVLAFVRL